MPHNKQVLKSFCKVNIYLYIHKKIGIKTYMPLYSDFLW